MFNRECHSCKKLLTYKSITSYRSALKSNSKCKSCAVKETHKKYPRMSGKDNPMYGTNLEKIWNKKYSKDIANKMVLSLSTKRSKNASGENNSMYGKPPGKGAGRGISGYYKNLHFRSSYELVFLLKFEEEFGTLTLSAETEKLKIEYDNNIYYSDFIYNNIIYEIKPLKMIPIYDTKIQAIKNYCRENKINFMLITEFNIVMPSNIKKWIVSLYNDNIISLTDYQLNRLLK